MGIKNIAGFAAPEKIIDGLIEISIDNAQDYAVSCPEHIQISDEDQVKDNALHLSIV